MTTSMTYSDGQTIEILPFRKFLVLAPSVGDSIFHPAGGWRKEITQGLMRTALGWYILSMIHRCDKHGLPGHPICSMMVICPLSSYSLYHGSYFLLLGCSRGSPLVHLAI